MKKKKTALLAGLLGAGVLAASAMFYKEALMEKQKAEALLQVRRFFADLGEIATVFVLEEESDHQVLVGGVIMVEGPVYLFEYNKGEIHYEEETL